MKKVVWSSILTTIAISCIAVGDASAQAAPLTQRQQLRTRIERRIQQRFNRLDQNGDGVIERSEWKRNERLFNRFDRDHDGALTLQEFRRMVRVVGARRLAQRRRG